MRHFRRLLIYGSIILLLLPTFVAGAITLPTGFSESILTENLGAVASMAFAPDGRLFVLLQTGAVRILKDDVLLPTPFITLTVSSVGERGVLGIAFDPNFATNQYVYIYYTATTPTIHNRLSRFTANGDVALAGSEVAILDLETLTATNHNGGAIDFGPDGKLYVGVGENAVAANAQSMTTRLGKMLRLNADGTIPTDNPFYNTASGDNRAIWALGLRNPYTFAFQRGTGRLFINDVGQSSWEEINDGIAGSNYGWPQTEGYTSNPAYRSPLYAYGHSGAAPTGCAISGGTFYNPPVVQFPGSYIGKYLFVDFCSNWIYFVDPGGSVPLTPTAFALSTTSNPVAVQVSSGGSLYYLARGRGGSVSKITFVSAETIGVFRPSQTSFLLRNTNTTGPANVSITFGASTDTPIVGDWDGDGVATPGVFRPATGAFFLSNSTGSPAVVHYHFTFGIPNDQPLVGDWDGDGRDSVGVFRRTNGLIYLRNNLTTGFADFQMVLGIPGDVGIAGDWNSDGRDSPGVYRPSLATFFLTNQRCNCSVFADYTVTFGIADDLPFVGDWDGDGRTGIGVFRSSNNTIYLRNDPSTSGFANLTAVYGIAGDLPLAGHWLNSTAAGSGAPALAPTFAPE